METQREKPLNNKVPTLQPRKSIQARHHLQKAKGQVEGQQRRLHLDTIQKKPPLAAVEVETKGALSVALNQRFSAKIRQLRRVRMLKNTMQITQNDMIVQILPVEIKQMRKWTRSFGVVGLSIHSERSPIPFIPSNSANVSIRSGWYPLMHIS